MSKHKYLVAARSRLSAVTSTAQAGTRERKQTPRSANFTLKVLVLAVAACFAPPALANPTGPVIVNGAASIVNKGNTLTVTNTPGAILNWQQFNISQGQTTQFNQQSAQSSVLNRVTGPDPSQILGTLKSNGQVFLINPSGIMFGAGSVIDVNRLIASTLNITNADFLANNLRFTGNSGASVLNQGQITTPVGGSVYLIGNNVTNQGVITTPQGDVLLAAGQSVSLVNSYTPHVSVTVTAGGQALNLGQVSLQGGSINIYGAVIKQQGLLNADSASINAQGQIVLSASQSVDLTAGSTTSANGAGNGGTISIDSGVAGTTTVSGSVSAIGAAGNGGTIETIGNNVGLYSGAKVDVSGSANGGNVYIGGNFHGAGPQHNASRVIVAQGAFINADGGVLIPQSLPAQAGAIGSGGNVAVWSDNYTQFMGNISARGGANGGNGGFVETSGKQTLGFAGLVDTRAPKGLAGTLLLDPMNITISTAANTVTMLNTAGTFADATALITSNLNTTTLQNQLALSNVIVDTTSVAALGVGNITVQSSIAWASAFGLTMNATGAGSIVVNATDLLAAPLFITNTGLGGVTMNTAAGAITVGGAINLTGGAFAATAGVGGAAISINAAINTGAGTVNLTAAGGGITEGAGGTIATTGTLTTSAAVGMTLFGANTVANFAATGGTGVVYLTNTATTLGLNAITSAGLVVNNTGSIAVNGAITQGGSMVWLNATGIITEGIGGSIAANTLTTSAVGGTTLNRANALGYFGATDTGAVSITDNAANTVLWLNAITSTGLTVNVIPGGGGLVISGAINTGASNITLTSPAVIAEAAGGSITTTGTLITSAAGGTTLDGANAVNFFGATDTGAVALTNTAPFVTPATSGTLTLGAITSGGLTVNNTGAITVNGQITAGAGNVTLNSTGVIAEGVSGSIATIGTLTTFAVGGTTLNGANTVSDFSANDTGAVSLTNTAPFVTPATSGTLTLGAITSGGLTVNNTGTITVNGPLSVAGLATLNGNTTILGTVNPGGVGMIGTVAVNGNLLLGTTSILNFELCGTGAGQYDKLMVTGNITKGGTLNGLLLAGYIPAVADTISILTMGGTSSGFFNTTNMQCGTGGPGGIYCFSVYENFTAGESVRLVYDTGIPNPNPTPTYPPINFASGAGNYTGITYDGTGTVRGTWTASVSSTGLITSTGSGTGTGHLMADGSFLDMLVTYANGMGSGLFSGTFNPATGVVTGTWRDLGPPYLSGTFSGQRVQSQNAATQTCLTNPVLCTPTSVTNAATTTVTAPVADTTATGNITYNAAPVIAAPVAITYNSIREARVEARRMDDEVQHAEEQIRLARTPEEKIEARQHAEAKSSEADAKRADAKIREAESELHAAAEEVKSDKTPEGKMRAETRRAVAEVKRAEGEVDKAAAEAKQAEAEAKGAKTPEARAAAEAKKVEAEARKVEAEVKKAEVEVKKAETELKQAEAEAKASGSAEAHATVESKKAEAESRKAEAEIRKAEVEIKSAREPAARAAAEAKLAEAEAKNAHAEAKKADVEARQAEAEARSSGSPVAKQVAEVKKAEAEAKKAEADIKSASAEAKSSNDPQAKAKAEVKSAEAMAKKSDAEAKKAEAEVKVAEAKAEKSGNAEDRKDVEDKKAEVSVKKADAAVKKAEAEVKSAKSHDEKEHAEISHADAEVQKAEAEYKNAEREAKHDKEEAHAPQSAWLAKAVNKKAEAAEVKAEVKKVEYEVKKLVAEVKRAEVEMKQAEVEVKEARTPEARAMAEKHVQEKRAEVEIKRSEAQTKEQKVAALKAVADSKEAEFKDAKRSGDSKIVEVFSGMALAGTAKERVQETMVARHEFMKETLKPALNILKADPHAADLKPCGAGGGDVCMRPVNPAVMNPAADILPRVQLPVLTPTTSFLPTIQRKVAVVIGNNAYQDPNIPSLNGAISDADAIGNVFKEKMGYEVRMVHNGTRADIVRTLNQVSDETGSRDSVVIYYAGHGYQMDDTKVGYWIPSDATVTDPGKWISNSDINKMLTNIPAKQMILMSDSCYSGALTSEQKVTSASSKGESVQEILGKRSVLVMSSGGEEPVMDEGREGHSIFAWHLMDRLNNVEQYKNGGDVFDAVKAGVAGDGIPQVPQYGASTSAGHTPGGEYLFEVRKY